MSQPKRGWRGAVYHVCPAVGCSRKTRSLLCRVHEPMVSKQNRGYLANLRRLAKADPFLYEDLCNRAWQRILAMIAAKEGRPLVGLLVGATR